MVHITAPANTSPGHIRKEPQIGILYLYFRRNIGPKNETADDEYKIENQEIKKHKSDTEKKS